MSSIEWTDKTMDDVRAWASHAGGVTSRAVDAIAAPTSQGRGLKRSHP